MRSTSIRGVARHSSPSWLEPGPEPARRSSRRSSTQDRVAASSAHRGLAADAGADRLGRTGVPGPYRLAGDRDPGAPLATTTCGLVRATRSRARSVVAHRTPSRRRSNGESPPVALRRLSRSERRRLARSRPTPAPCSRSRRRRESSRRSPRERRRSTSPSARARYGSRTGAPSRGRAVRGAGRRCRSLGWTGTRTAATRQSRLPRLEARVATVVDNHLAVSPGASGQSTPDVTVVRVEPTTGGDHSDHAGIRAVSVAAGPAGVWALGVDGSVARLDERTGRPLPAARYGGIVGRIDSVGRGRRVGDVSHRRDAVAHRGPAPGDDRRDRRSTSGSDVAVGRAATVWVANPVPGQCAQVDLRLRAGRAHARGGRDTPRASRSTTTPSGSPPRPDPTRRRRRPRSRGSADPRTDVRARHRGGGRGRSPSRLGSATPGRVVRPARRRLRRRSPSCCASKISEQGASSVAYQSCDDSIASTGLYDEAKCASNARAYAENHDVVGVIGTLNSPCAVAALPELNRAVTGRSRWCRRPTPSSGSRGRR